MGMTDLQFKDFLRGLLDDIASTRKALQEDKPEDADKALERLEERFKAAIED